MKNTFLTVAPLFLLINLSTAFAADTPPAGTPVDTSQGGTLKGAAVGGVGGAVVGHPVAGAVVGGIIGHHRRHKAEKAALKQQEESRKAAPNQ